MASVPTRTVGVVVDPEFGSRVVTLAREMYLWVRGSPANLAAVDAVRASGTEITSFVASSEDSPEEAVLGILADVDLHHGPYSQASPWAEVFVFGASSTPEIRSLLAEIGFGEPEPTTEGFRSVKVEG